MSDFSWIYIRRNNEQNWGWGGGRGRGMKDDMKGDKMTRKFHDYMYAIRWFLFIPEKSPL